MRIGLNLAQKLLLMTQGKEVNGSEFTGNSLTFVHKMIAEGRLIERRIGNTQRKVSCPSEMVERLIVHLRNQHGIVGDLQEYVNFLQTDASYRNEVLRSVKDDKFRRINVFEGFLVNCYDELRGVLNGQEILLKPKRGSFVFINDFRRFEVDSNVIVVGVENFENFKFIQEQRNLFCSMTPMFVWRYQNSVSIAQWLQGTQNNYLHFGDFDLKGVHIYITEFRNKLSAGRCNFLLPDGIYDKIRLNGLAKRYDEQLEFLKRFDFSQSPETVPLVTKIHEYKKGLPQESFIQLP